MYVSWFVFSPFSVCLLMSVTVSGYIITHCMSIYVSPLCLCVFLSLNICISVGLYCHSLYVYISTSLGPCVSLTFSLWMPPSVFGYIVTDCTCIGTSLHLSFSLSQSPGILLVNLQVYVRLLIGISLSFFVSECVKQCPPISSLIVAVSVHLLIRIAHSLSPPNVSIRIRLYCLWFQVYRYVSPSPFSLSLSLSLSLCPSQCPSILFVIWMYVINRVQLDQRVIGTVKGYSHSFIIT